MRCPGSNQPLQFFFKRPNAVRVTHRLILAALTDSGNHLRTLVTVVEAAAQPDALAVLAILNGEIPGSFTGDGKAEFAEMPGNVISVFDEPLSHFFFKVPRNEDPHVSIPFVRGSPFSGLQFGDMSGQSDSLDAGRIIRV